MSSSAARIFGHVHWASIRTIAERTGYKVSTLMKKEIKTKMW
jgi:hypothetical protein